MKWVLVVLIGGMSPIQTNVTFVKLSDCLAAADQLRQTYAEAFDAWNRRTQIAPDRFERPRRREYYRDRDPEAKMFANTGTCVPHAGTDQPITSLSTNDPQPSPPPDPAPPPAPTATPPTR
jgi:hypothetical protein